MIVDIINEIKEFSKEPKEKLFERLIQERLQLAVESYYSDLNSKFDYYYNKSQSKITYIKPLVK